MRSALTNLLIINRFKSIFSILLLQFMFSASAFCENPAATEPEKHEKSSHEKFNAGEMIIDHIIDAHEWHIVTVGETHVSVPLPVILIDNGKFEFFFSSKFHHGTQSYNGYKIESEGKNKGKIVRVLEDGITTDETAALPLDFSITKNTLTVFFILALLCFVFISVANAYKKNRDHAPKGLQAWVEPLIIFVRDDIAKASIGEKKYERYMPYLLTIFFFIFFGNLLGMVPFFPGGANVTGNIAITMVLALFTFTITTFSGNKSYFVHIVNTPGVPWWLKLPLPLMPIVEIIGVITKPFVLMVRLFANISAGHIIALGFVALIFIFGEMNVFVGYAVSPVSIGFGIFMAMIELLVAFLQAYVFTLLSAIYFGMATEEHAHNEENAH
jgi:F-type H+-transporting ATPase subunit a